MNDIASVFTFYDYNFDRDYYIIGRYKKNLLLYIYRNYFIFTLNHKRFANNKIECLCN